MSLLGKNGIRFFPKLLSCKSRLWKLICVIRPQVMEADMCHTTPGYGSRYVSYDPRLWKLICVMQAQVMEADMCHTSPGYGS